MVDNIGAVALHSLENGAGPSTVPHRMRITSGGSIQAYVRFALSHLQTSPATPLLLHTIPLPTKGEPSTSQTTSKPPDQSSGKAKGPSTLYPGTVTAPRLISVVEILKRDYLVGLNSSGKGKGKHRATGLWQYTETGLLPRELEGARGVEDGLDLVRVLEGNTKPKMTHQPYLQITLSTRPLGLERRKNVTCQYVLGRRARKKGEKDGDGDLEGAENQQVSTSKAVSETETGRQGGEAASDAASDAARMISETPKQKRKRKAFSQGSDTGHRERKRKTSGERKRNDK